jgi:DNA-binding HxlR family transcriptional regulator
MSEITLSTTVADLVAAGLITSPTQLESILKRKSKSKVSDPMIQETAGKVLEAINSRPVGAKWKTGILNQIVFGMIKGISDETERRHHHGIISKALKSLAADGLIDKPHVTNAAHSYYLRIEGVEAPQVETQVLGLPLHEEEVVEAVIVEEVVEVKPKARVRKSKKSKK